MEHPISHYATTRHTAKAYDSSRAISAADMEQIRTLLRNAASSVNLQPWHFVIASTPDGKERVAKGTDEKYPFNSKAIRDCSHAIVFACRSEISDEYIQKVLDKEVSDKRLVAEEAKHRQLASRTMFTNIHRDAGDVKEWSALQTYLNLGALLLGAATLGIDATPMEGVDTEALDKEFGFSERGLSALVVVTLGYSDEENDYNAKLPKSRLDWTEIATEI